METEELYILLERASIKWADGIPWEEAMRQAKEELTAPKDK